VVSRKVTLSDTFDDQLATLLVAALRYIQDPDDGRRHYDYSHADIFEYDTRIQRAVRSAVHHVLSNP
jgi:hypothetical protein